MELQLNAAYLSLLCWLLLQGDGRGYPALSTFCRPCCAPLRTHIRTQDGVSIQPSALFPSGGPIEYGTYPERQSLSISRNRGRKKVSKGVEAAVEGFHYPCEKAINVD